MKHSKIYYFNAFSEAETERLATQLHQLIMDNCVQKGKEGVLLLCIGTDRSTGDSLGPLIGYKLRKAPLRRIRVFGTLESPVHAMNLKQALQIIQCRYPNQLVVAVDASVGSPDHVGYLTLGQGSIRPGLGVYKELDEVGDMFLTGIVGGYAGCDPIVLQSVRLAVVMRMADCVCESIRLVEQLWENMALL